jgi:hypothetical protein
MYENRGKNSLYQQHMSNRSEILHEKYRYWKQKWSNIKLIEVLMHNLQKTSYKLQGQLLTSSQLKGFEWA